MSLHTSFGVNSKGLGWVGVLVLGFVPAVVAAPACHHDDAVTKTATAASVVGPQDSHCGAKVVTVDPAVCKVSPAADGGTGDGGASTADAGAGGYPPTMSNAEGDDDDCKYRIKWSTGGATTATTTKTSSLHPLHGEETGGAGTGGDVVFTVTLTNKKDGSPLTGAPINIEAFLDETHPSLNTEQTSKETTPGTYTVGPVRFDVSGRWTVRFHIHDECNDSEASPHGHGAFFAQIAVQ